MKHHDEEDAELFPPSWEVTRLLVANFSEYTRADLANVLGKGTPNVALLLEALQSTLDFEDFFAKRFGIPVSLSFERKTDRSLRMSQLVGPRINHQSSGQSPRSLTPTSLSMLMRRIGEKLFFLY